MRNFLPALRGRPTVVVPTALLAVCAAVLPLSPAAAESGPLSAGPSPQAGQRSSAGGGTVSSIPLTAPHRLAGSGSLPAAAARTLAPRRTGRFELLGVTWDGPSSALDGAAVRVRTRDAATGAWRGWQRLDVDGDEGPDTPA
ncbi:hypothetical protein ACFU6L_27090, partial [Kitasatospora sp. NPDC057541]